ncbi:hypothetical protein PFNF135_01357 [Plasmodium falciparum NF135/5.C10]|uniref:Plasmodium falciparum erythrocyte membrane protein 1 acidic terminal segment domain-containing protein n=1 Tax=Plasmodium falciparum NF135/5.C10 TaxID=1036726 RepID=W4IM62_PLAFA|nr:hypothetical protein PFNF135_01357 [Plasmodium falciparum NF135/5.C10]
MCHKRRKKKKIYPFFTNLWLVFHVQRIDGFICTQKGNIYNIFHTIFMLYRHKSIRVYEHYCCYTRINNYI